jgi:hypothetical protein
MDGSSAQGDRKQSCGELRQRISPLSFIYIFIFLRRSKACLFAGVIETVKTVETENYSFISKAHFL